MPDRVKPGFEGFGELLPREDRDRVLRRLQPCRLETQTLVTIRLSPSLPPAAPHQDRGWITSRAGRSRLYPDPHPMLDTSLRSFKPRFFPKSGTDPACRSWQFPAVTILFPAVTILQDLAASCRYNIRGLLSFLPLQLPSPPCGSVLAHTLEPSS